MAEALAKECYRAGALPIIVYDSDSLYGFRLSDEVSEDTLLQTPMPLLGITQNITAQIALSGPSDPMVFSMGSPAKLEAIALGSKKVNDLMTELKVRGVYIQYGFVTPARANIYGVDYESWANSVEKALNANLDEIAKRADAISKPIANAKKIRITAPNGTDLTLSTHRVESLSYMMHLRLLKILKVATLGSAFQLVQFLLRLWKLLEAGKLYPIGLPSGAP